MDSPGSGLANQRKGGDTDDYDMTVQYSGLAGFILAKRSLRRHATMADANRALVTMSSPPPPIRRHVLEESGCYHWKDSGVIDSGTLLRTPQELA